MRASPPPDPDRAIRARHVAGHVVVALALGLTVPRARLDGGFGEPEFDLDGDTRRLTVRGLLALNLAGRAAEAATRAGPDGNACCPPPDDVPEKVLKDAATERLAMDMLTVLKTFEALGLRGMGMAEPYRVSLSAALADFFEREAAARSLSALAGLLCVKGAISFPDIAPLAEPEALSTELRAAFEAYPPPRHPTPPGLSAPDRIGP